MSKAVSKVADKVVSEQLNAGLSVRLSQQAPIPLDAALDCAPGELLALVGPSGSGKTTILRCIAGLQAAATGEVRCGKDVWFERGNYKNNNKNLHLPPQNRRVGFVFQNYALFPHLTALENVVTALNHLPASERALRARELIARVHLEGLEERRPQALSGGQQQRVAVARALARVLQNRSSVLLLDEPFSAVDQVTRRKLQHELARLRATLNIPMIMVTHDLDEARMLADRITILHRGTTLQSGTPEEVLSRPKNASVARLVQLTNVFEGAVVAGDAEGLGKGAARRRLQWLNYSLEIENQSLVDELTLSVAQQNKVCWVIPPEHIVLHQRVRPSQGERENPVTGELTDCTLMGETTSLTLLANNDRNGSLTFNVPTHVARRNSLMVGETISVSLRAEGIHLMPWEQLRD